MLEKIKKYYFLFVLLISLIVIVGAYIIEYLYNFPPCKLCIYQRIPYLIAIFITFLGISYSKNLFWLYTLLLVFFSSFLLSGYHFGIEQEVFKEFSGCTGNSLDIIDKNELLKILNSEVNSCKNVDFKIFGLSLATINFLLSFIIFILILKVIKNEKNK